MSIELFLIIAFAIIGVILAAWVTVLSSVISDLAAKNRNLHRLLSRSTLPEERKP